MNIITLFSASVAVLVVNFIHCFKAVLVEKKLLKFSDEAPLPLSVSDL